MEIRCYSRLHFGLLSACSPGSQPPAPGEVHPRSYGGAGLMIANPSLHIAAEPAPDWKASGPGADRALEFIEACRQSLAGSVGPPLYFRIVSMPPAHAGLGSGTQLGLAIARLMALGAGRQDVSEVELAGWVHRGRRSALGIHGFRHGGFLVEAGKHDAANISPLALRLEFPSDWPIVLVIPKGQSGLSGAQEAEAFRQLEARPYPAGETERLCRLLLLGAAPALVERDFQSFARAIYEYNRRVGECFAAVQGGVYSHPGMAKLLHTLLRNGFDGVGQSSWGPSAYIFCENEDQAAAAIRIVKDTIRAEVVVTRAANEGALVQL